MNPSLAHVRILTLTAMAHVKAVAQNGCLSALVSGKFHIEFETKNGVIRVQNFLLKGGILIYPCWVSSKIVFFCIQRAKICHNIPFRRMCFHNFSNESFELLDEYFIYWTYTTTSMVVNECPKTIMPSNFTLRLSI